MTAQLLKRLLAVALVATICLSFAGLAPAGPIPVQPGVPILGAYNFTNTNLFSQGVSAGPTPPPGPFGPPLPGVTSIGVQPARFFTNTFAGAGTANADVRDVFAGVIASAHDDVSYSPINGPHSTAAAPTFLNVVGAINGTAPQTSFSSTLTVLSGGFEVIESRTPLNPVAPSTWLGGAGATVLATFTLGPAASLTPGSPHNSESAQLTFPASVMNQSSINIVDPTQNQGRILFLNGVGGTPGASGFLLPGDPSAPQPPFGLFAHFGQAVEDVTAATSNLTAADLTIMNGIFATFTDPATMTNLPNNVWATGLGAGPESNWNPPSAVSVPNPNPPPATLRLPTDFRAVGEGVEFNPFSAVPEPASVALMGMGLGSLVLAVRRRKNKTQA